MLVFAVVVSATQYFVIEHGSSLSTNLGSVRLEAAVEVVA